MTKIKAFACILGFLVMAVYPRYMLAQPTGSFEISVPLGLESHTLAFYVPAGYNPQYSWHLIVGLHGGGGTGVGYRNYLVDVANGYPALVVCPDNNGGSFSGPAEQLILKAIDTACHLYNIDPAKIILNGYSMNGFETYRLGLSSFYNFKGIIPYNAVLLAGWLPQLNLASDVPACICSGSLDSYHSINQQVYNTMLSNGGKAYFNSIAGIEHDLDPHFAPAVLQCMFKIDSLMGPMGVQEKDQEASLVVYPNPAKNILNIRIKQQQFQQLDLWISNLLGQRLNTEMMQSSEGDGILSMDISSLHPGIYFIHYQQYNKILTKKILVYR